MLTEHEIQARKTRIGASDVASILGMPTFKGRNAYSTWLDKTDQLEPEADKPWLDAGNRLEPVILDYAETQYGELERNVVVFDPTGAPIASTLDGKVVADPGGGRPVEAKTSGIFGPIHGTWGEPGSDEVPDGYIMQCQTQLLCTGADLCPLVALLGSRGFVEFFIEPDEYLMKTIRDVATDFFERYVTQRRDPREDWADRLHNTHGIELLSDPCQPVLETVRRFRKQPAKVITIKDPARVLDWQKKTQVRLDAQKAENTAQAALLADLADAEGADLPDGTQLTHFETQRKGYTVKPSSHRTLRLRKIK
jgi:putative phage-type endonuclease